MKNPYTIGGTDASGYRQDTHIMQLNSDLISKNWCRRLFYLFIIIKEMNFAY